ncbi:hypothetical protein B0T14DRAFT_441261, partial [Immersiella caudata]
FSDNYQGERDNTRNQSADILDSQNCSFWIVGLAPDVTVNDVLDQIKNIGRVFQVYINEAVGKHPTSAAKLTFFDLEGARRFLAKVQREGGFRVGSHLARVMRNRIKVAQQGKRSKGHSRVIKLYGSRVVLHRARIDKVLSGEIKIYNIEFYEEVEHSVPGEVAITIRFGSYRAQTEGAWKLFNQHFEEDGIRIEYGVDPCDRVEE